MAKRTVKSVKASCDRLWAKLVKARAGYKCERCGAEPEDQRGFHSHHIYGRSNHRLRFEPRNGLAFCYPCHLWAETHPLDFSEWMHEYAPEDVAYLSFENALGLISRDLYDYLDLEAELTFLLSNTGSLGD